ncbi:MAG: helix-turn-helix domain-containing protein [Hyphomicrobiales bacterium]
MRASIPPLIMQRQPANRFLTTVEAADYLGLSPRTLEKQRVYGGGPDFRKFGRRVMYAIEDLDRWAEAQLCRSTSDAGYHG